MSNFFFNTRRKSLHSIDWHFASILNVHVIYFILCIIFHIPQYMVIIFTHSTPLHVPPTTKNIIF